MDENAKIEYHVEYFDKNEIKTKLNTNKDKNGSDDIRLKEQDGSGYYFWDGTNWTPIFGINLDL